MCRARLAGVALCALLAALPTWANPVWADPVRVTARWDGDAVIVEAQARLRAPLHLIWEVLTGYDRYAEFVPDLQSSRVLSRDGHTALIEQRGTAGFFLYRFPLEVKLTVTEVPFERVTCQAVAGNFKELSGVYELFPETDAARDPGGSPEGNPEGNKVVRFGYRGRLVPAFRLPPLIGLPALRASVERQFGALVREVERRSARLPAPDAK
jgi:ribosome-associated toxin RatA of RatAB toxin-antitoxin module